MQIKVKLLDSEAVLPSRAYDSDAGNDLCSIEDATLLPGERRLFRTGISMSIPPNYYGQIAPRSGLSLKSGITVLGGVIDCLYRGDIGVILVNLGQNPVHISKFQKIAQLIIKRCERPDFIVVDNLSETERGSGGFGSTDQKQSGWKS